MSDDEPKIQKIRDGKVVAETTGDKPFHKAPAQPVKEEQPKPTQPAAATQPPPAKPVPVVV
jgi:hypothetical protein